MNEFKISYLCEYLRVELTDRMVHDVSVAQKLNPTHKNRPCLKELNLNGEIGIMLKSNRTENFGGRYLFVRTEEALGTYTTGIKGRPESLTHSSTKKVARRSGEPERDRESERERENWPGSSSSEHFPEKLGAWRVLGMRSWVF